MKYINSEDIKVFPSYWRNTVANAEGQLTVYDLDSGETSEKSLTKLNSENKTYVVSYDSGTFEIVVCGYYFKFQVPQELLSSNDLTALVKVKDNVLIPYTDKVASNLDVLVEATQDVEAHNEFRGLALSTAANPEIAENVYSLKIWNHTTNSVPKESWFKYKSRDIEVGTNKELGEVVDLVEDVISDNGDINSKNNNKIGTVSKPFDRIYVNDIRLLNQESSLTFKDIKAKSINNTNDSWYIAENGDAKFNNITATLNGTSKDTLKLKTSVNLGVSLSKVSSTSFNGSEDVTNIGVSGILRVGNGGLGTDLTNSTGILYHSQGNSSVTTLTLWNTEEKGDIYTVSKVDELLEDTTNFIQDNMYFHLDEKVDKKDGYRLSKNDFTDALLTKLNGIEEGANKYSLPLATSSVRGGIKIGYTSSNTLNRPLLLDNERAYINIDPSVFIKDSGTSRTEAASCYWTNSLATRIATNELNIDTLQTRVADLGTEVANLNDSVTVLQAKTNVVEENITRLNTSVTSLQTNVSGLQTNVNKLLPGAPTRHIYSGLKTDSNGYITDHSQANTIFNMLYNHNRIVTAWQNYEEGDDITYYYYTQLLIEGNGTAINAGIHVTDTHGHSFTNEENITIMIVKLEGLS